MKAKIIHQKLTISKIVIVALLIIISSCNSDDIGDNYYTFTGETVGTYIKNRPETYSEFGKVLEETGVIGLLNAYGEYTCFLPDNEAMINFYKSRGKNSVDDFQLDSLKKIAYDHIIKGFAITTDDFTEGFLSKQTMSGRYINIGISTDETGLVYSVNTTSEIIEKDIEAHNGVIHAINEVLAPTENNLVEAISKDKNFSLFFEVLVATGLEQSLMLVKDESYVPNPAFLIEDSDPDAIYNYAKARTPREKKYGFTALMESNDTYANNGIKNLDDMKAYAKQVYDNMYPQDASVTDIKDRRNSLNRFVAYHLINKKLPKKLFIEKYDNSGANYATLGETHSVKVVDMFEYIETMCPNTLIEVRTLRETNEYNIFNKTESNLGIRLTTNYDNDALNGVYHEIDNILVYNADVERMLSTKRLRMDVASFFPEFVNNNMRVGHAASAAYQSEFWMIPQGFAERLEFSDNTKMRYFNSDDRFCDYQGDELFCESGLYDVKITTLPIPPGTYEVRFGWQPTIFRGAAQFYWDGQPTGIPLDMRITASDPSIAYVRPGSDARDPEGFENDKMMHNRGYMKGPASFKVIAAWWYTDATVNARLSASVLRRVLGVYTFNESTTHTFYVKGVRTGEFMFDYLEFVPLEVLEHEDIY